MKTPNHYYKITIRGIVDEKSGRKETPSGPIVDVVLRTVERFKECSAPWRDYAQFHLVRFQGDELTDRALREIEVGFEVLVKGTRQTRSWIDRRTGEERLAREILAEKLELIVCKPHEVSE